MESNSNKHINIDSLRVKKLGEVIESGFKGGLQDSDDKLLSNLLEYRTEKRNKARKKPVPSDEIWSSIDQKIGNGPSEQATVHRLNINNHILSIWLSVAATVILVFLGIHFYSGPNANHMIAESRGVQLTYTTSDGSKITLRPHSKLYLLHKSTSFMKYKLDGEAFFNVVHNPNRQFVVEAGAGEVRVLGTRFNVSDRGHTVQVYLQKGSVYFRNRKTHQHVILKPGESSTITQKGDLLPPKKQDQSKYLGWIQNVMTFHHQKVNFIFDELDQHYNITILKGNLSNTFLSETVTGQIHLQNLQRSLKDLGLVLSGHFKKIGSRKYKFIPIK